MALLLDDPAFLFAGASLAVIPVVSAFAFRQKTREILASVSVIRRPEKKVARQGMQISLEVTVGCKVPPGTRIRIREILPPGVVRTGDIPEIMFPTGDPPVVVYPLIPLIHGRLEIPGVRIDIADRFFQTAAEMTAPAYAGPEIQVFPVSFIETRSAQRMAGGHQETNRFSIYKGSTVRSFREYVPGDDLRFIDWKLSAKYEKYIVREYGAQEKKPGLLVLDLPDRSAGFDEAAFAHLINRMTGEAERSIRTSGEVSILLISGINLTDMILNERSLSRCNAWIREEAYPRNRLYHSYRLETASDIRKTLRTVKRQVMLAQDNQDMQVFLNRFNSVIAQNLVRQDRYTFDIQILRLLHQAGPFDEMRIYSMLIGDVSHIRHIFSAAQNAHIDKRLFSPAFRDKKNRARFAEWYGAGNLEVTT
jgi:hypothetical protein